MTRPSIENAGNNAHNAEKDAVEQQGGPLHFPAEDEVAMDKSNAHTKMNAKAATDKEHSMTLLQGIKLYPKAIFWSVVISTCIAMEGYDVCLINNVRRSTIAGSEARNANIIIVLCFPPVQPQIRCIRRSLRRIPGPCVLASRSLERCQRGRDHRSAHQRYCI